ncbi:MAG: hypothetical protein V4689_00690 [Verrucomicrobiota bacterium]
MPSLPPACWKWVPYLVPAMILGGTAAAQVVCYENFTGYGAGVRVESGANGSSGTGLDGGFGWGGPYDVSNAIKSLVLVENRTASPVNYSNGDISIQGGNRALRFYDNATGTYAVQRPLGTVFQAIAGETLWFSVLFRTAAGGASPLANQDFFQIGFDDNDDAAGGIPRVSIGSNTISDGFPSAYHFFARSTAAVSGSAFDDDIPITASTTYLLVGSVTPNNEGGYDTVSLFVNPSSMDDPGPPSASVTLASGLTTLSHAFIRTHALDGGDAYVLDEWCIGRDYGSVVQSLRHALKILPASEPETSPTLRWSAFLSGVVLETSTTLEPESWAEVSGPFPTTGGDCEHPVMIDPEIPRRFYRLRR